MGILLAITVMVVAGASLLIAYSLRTWSHSHEERFAAMRREVHKYNEDITALQAAVTAVNNDLDKTISAVAEIRQAIAEMRVELPGRQRP
jgi:peptidoglycan hydrolase CwlO-like protein